MKENKKYFKNLDFFLIFLVFLISGFGLYFLYSATYNLPNFSLLFTKQIVAVFLGFIAIFLFSIIDYNHYRYYSKHIYFIAILLLIFVLFAGKTTRGSKSWFHFAGFSFQPAEFARIAFILFFAKFLDKDSIFIKSFANFLKGSLILFPLVFLILLQPDFGAILVLFPIFMGMYYAAGVAKLFLFIIIFLGTFVVALPLFRTFLLAYNPEFLKFTNFYYILALGFLIFVVLYGIFSIKKRKFLNKNIAIYFFVFFTIAISIGEFCDRHIKDYQRNRLIVFFSPEFDSLGAGYNVIQSKIAVGSGGLFGKGFKKGSQIQLGFLPERHTDFIFSVIGEEGGFIVSFVVLVIYFLICYRLYFIAKNSKDRFGSLTVLGFFILFSFFVFLNIGFVIGILPVTGVPLPFISYGGTAFIINCMMIGIVLNVDKRRYVN